MKKKLDNEKDKKKDTRYQSGCGEDDMIGGVNVKEVVSGAFKPAGTAFAKTIELGKETFKPSSPFGTKSIAKGTAERTATGLGAIGAAVTTGVTAGLGLGAAIVGSVGYGVISGLFGSQQLYNIMDKKPARTWREINMDKYPNTYGILVAGEIFKEGAYKLYYIQCGWDQGDACGTGSKDNSLKGLIIPINSGSNQADGGGVYILFKEGGKFTSSDKNPIISMIIPESRQNILEVKYLDEKNNAVSKNLQGNPAVIASWHNIFADWKPEINGKPPLPANINYLSDVEGMIEGTNIDADTKNFPIDSDTKKVSLKLQLKIGDGTEPGTSGTGTSGTSEIDIRYLDWDIPADAPKLIRPAPNPGLRVLGTSESEKSTLGPEIPSFKPDEGNFRPISSTQKPGGTRPARPARPVAKPAEVHTHPSVDNEFDDDPGNGD